MLLVTNNHVLKNTSEASDAFAEFDYEEDKAALWCIANDICIVPRAIKYGERIWVIDIEKGKYPNRKRLGTSQPFGPNTIWEKVSEYQLYYYKKYAK